MQIKELYIENFGKLSKYKKSFTEGVNCIFEENGFGKTTLSVFIKAMLYGLDDTKKTSLDENERKRYLPWQGGSFGGWLSFSALGGEYRIERTFGQKASDDTFMLYNLDTGKPTQVFSDKIGEEIFGIDSDGFERTVFLSEKNLSGKNTNQSISAKLSNIVEVDGDIGGFDNALKLLDDRRKFYQKRGGSGEIHDLEEAIADTEAKINTIKQNQADAAALETDIAKLSENTAAAKRKKAELLEKQRKENFEREQKRYHTQYMEMIGALKVDEDRETALLEFFARKIPTVQEIGAISDLIAERGRLNKALEDMGSNSEYSSLKDFFSNQTTEDECDKIVSRAQNLEEKRAKYTSLLSSANEKIPSILKRMPTAEELANAKRLASEKPRKKSKVRAGILTLLGIAVSTVGGYLGYTTDKMLYLVASVGVLLTIVGISSLLSSKAKRINARNNRAVAEFIESVLGDTYIHGDNNSAIALIENEMDKYNRAEDKRSGIGSEAEALLLDIRTDERHLREFIERYPLQDELTLKDSASEIRRKFVRYSILRESESNNETKRELYRTRIASLDENAGRFLSQFPTKSDTPLDEIRNNLAEYEVLHATLTRRKSDCERFARMHSINIDAGILPKAEELSSVVEDELRQVDEELLAIERSRSDLKIRYNELLKDSDKLDELEEKLIEDNETISRYLDNLSIIKKTVAMLNTAKTNMTARYLDPMRKSFTKYITLMDNEKGEYTMDTSFTVMKTDLGKSRQAEAYSRGTRDLHALAVRLALVDSLYEGEKPPIILDDPFTSFDDRRTDKALSVVKKLSADSQIIYFTCSKSRRTK